VLGNDEDEVGHDVGAKEKKQVAKRKRKCNDTQKHQEGKSDDKETFHSAPKSKTEQSNNPPDYSAAR